MKHHGPDQMEPARRPPAPGAAPSGELQHPVPLPSAARQHSAAPANSQPHAQPSGTETSGKSPLSLSRNGPIHQSCFYIHFIRGAVPYTETVMYRGLYRICSINLDLYSNISSDLSYIGTKSHLRMAREERFRFLVVFMLGQLGAGIRRVALPGWAVTSWRGDTGSCAVSPPPWIAYASARSPARGRRSSSELPRWEMFLHQCKRPLGVKELIRSYPPPSCPRSRTGAGRRALPPRL